MKTLLMLMFSTTVMAAPTTVEVVPAPIKLNAAGELKKCQCKCKRRSNMTDLMDAKEFLEQELQKIEGEPEQTLN